MTKTPCVEKPDAAFLMCKTRPQFAVNPKLTSLHQVRKRLVQPWLFILFLSTCVLAAGQGPTGTINGMVTDATGAVMANATVLVENTATGISRTLSTDDNGLYTVPALQPEVYKIVIDHAGFEKVERNNIILHVQQTARLNFSLSVGSAVQTVEVSGSAPLLFVGDTTVGQVIESRRIVDLPLNGRNYLQLASLSPGVTNTSSPSNGANSIQGGSRGAISITINGQRNDFNHYSIDGIENTDPNFNTYILLPSVDALQEFKLQTATYPSEFGFSVSQINVTTKSGTNGFHGSAFECLRNSWFDAENYFDTLTAPIPEFRCNQFGAIVGGPIIRNRLFFIGNYEGLRDSKAQTRVSTVTLSALTGGNFTGLNTIYDPSTRTAGSGGTITATHFPGNMINSSRFSPIATALLKYWGSPKRSGTSNNYVNNEALTNTRNQYMARIDYQMTKSLSCFGRYNFD
jgi:hypothetical protein